MDHHERATLTDWDVTEFLHGIAYYRKDEIHPGKRYTWNFHVDDAQTLKRVRDSLETVGTWARSDETVDEVTRMIAVINKSMKAAVKNGDRVDVTFTGADLIALRPGVLLLDRLDLTKQADAREAERTKNWGKRK